MPAFREVLTAVERVLPRQAGGDPRARRALDQRARQRRGQQRGRFREAVSARRSTRRSTASAQSYDSDARRLRRRPKVSASDVARLLSLWHAQPRAARAHTLAMVTHTLDRMAERGLYDHLGGGFFRYTVDARWSIPHFEKMLYDNAQLLARVCRRVRGDRQGRSTRASRARRPNGSCATCRTRAAASTRRSTPTPSTRKASSTSGRRRTSTRCSTPHESALAKRVFGLEEPANFEGKHWHLHRAHAPEAAEAELAEAARRKLLAARERRVWPGRDEKVLVSWNGLAVAGLARAARVLDRPDFAASATRAVDFIRAELWHDGRLKADVQRRPRAFRGVSRRLRVPRLRLARAVANALARQRPDDRSAARRRANIVPMASIWQ